MSFFGRLGSEEMKFQIDLILIKVETTSLTDPICVKLTRGAKQLKSLVVAGRSGNYDFASRPLSLGCTLYRKRDKWLPKEAEVAVMSCKGTERLFGKVTIDLAHYVDMTEKTFSETWPLEKCVDKRAKITVKIHSKWLKGAAAASIRDDEASTSQMAQSKNEEEAQNIDDFIGNDGKHVDDSQQHEESNIDDEEQIHDEDYEDAPPQPQRRPSLQQQRAAAAADRGKREENKEITNPRTSNISAAQKRRQQPVEEFHDEDREESQNQPDEDNEEVVSQNDREEELIARIANRANRSSQRPPQQPSQQQRAPIVPVTSRPADRRAPPPRSRHWRDDDEEAEIKEASESEEILEDEDEDSQSDEADGGDLSEDPNRRVKFGPAQRKLSTDKPQSPHHQSIINQPTKSNLKQSSPKTLAATNGSITTVTVNTQQSSPSTTPPAPSTPSSSSNRSSPRASITSLVRSVKPIGPSAIFNCSLLQAMTLNPRASSLDVPYIFDVLLQALERNEGLTSEGIFRLSANPAKVSALKSQLESGNYKILINDPHVIANVFKSWLMSINQNDPIIPLSLHTACLEIGKIDLDRRNPQTELVKNELNKIVPQFPLLTQRLLIRLLDFLIKLGSAPYVQQNRMNLHALSVVFAPSILSIQADNRADGFEIFNRAKYAVRFVEHLIENKLLLEQLDENQAPKTQQIVTTTTIPIDQTISSATQQRALPVGAVPTPMTAAMLQSRNKTNQQSSTPVKTVTTIPLTSPPRGQRPPLPAQSQRSPAAAPVDADHESDEEVLDDSEEEILDDSEPSEIGVKNVKQKNIPDDRSHSESESPIRPSQPQLPRVTSKNLNQSAAVTTTIKRVGEDSSMTARAATQPVNARRFPIQRDASDSEIENSQQEEIHSDEESEQEEINSRRNPQPPARQTSLNANNRTQQPPRPPQNSNPPPTKLNNLAPPQRAPQQRANNNNSANVFDDESDEEIHSNESSANIHPALVIHENSEDGEEEQKQQKQKLTIQTLQQQQQPASVVVNAATQARLEEQAEELQAVRSTVARYEDLINKYKSAEAQRALDEEAAARRRESDAKERETIREKEIIRLKQEKELKSTQAELEVVRKQLESSNILINKRNTEIIELKQKSRNPDEIKMKDQQISELTTRLESLESQLTESSHTNDEEINKLHDHIESLERELESQRAIMVKQRTEISDTKKTIDEINNENEELHRAIEQTEKQLNETEEKMRQALKTAAEATNIIVAQQPPQAAVNDADDVSDSEFELYEDDSDEVVDLKQRVMKLKKIVKRKNSEIKTLKRAAANSGNLTASPANSVAGSVPSSPLPQSPRVDHSECQRLLRSLETKIEFQNKEILELQQQIQTMEKENTIISDNEKEIEKQLKQKELHVTELIGQVKELKSRLKTSPPPPPPPAAPVVTSSAKDREEIARLKSESELTQSQLLSLEQQLSGKDERIAEYEKRLSEYEESIQSMKSESLQIRQLNKTIESKMNSIETRTDVATNITEEFNLLKKSKEAAEEKIILLENSLESLQEDKKLLEQQLINSKNSLHSRNNSPLSSPATISSVTAQRELTKNKEALEQLKLKWETLKIDSRARIERERKHRESLEEQLLTIQEENELLRQRQENQEELNKMMENILNQNQNNSSSSITSKIRSSSKNSSNNISQLTSLLSVANHRISFLETHVKSCDEILLTAKQSWSASSELIETEMSRMQAEIDTQKLLLSQATENKPVEYSQLELLHKKLLRSEKAREQLQREIEAYETKINKFIKETEKAQNEAKQQKIDNELLKQDLIKQGIALKTIADDNFELKEWLRLNTKGKSANK